MHIDILTLFPEMTEAVAESSILGRAQKSGVITVNSINIRDFTKDRHKKTDEAPYGGGAGMIMTAQPVFDALRSVNAEKSRILYMSPKGRIIDRDVLSSLASEQRLVFLCGHYEGIDQRIIDYWNPEELSIGDYILTGGELAALVIIDALSRMIPGVLGNEDSVMGESVYSGLLEYPQYTRPREYEGMTVPDVLLSGDHENVGLWQYRRSLEETRDIRPDMWNSYLKKAESLDLSRKELEILADVSGDESFRPLSGRKKKKKKASALLT